MAKTPLYPHVPKIKSQTVVSPAMDACALEAKESEVMIGLLKKWHEVIGEMLIDNDIDLTKYPTIKGLHAKTFKVIKGR